eukprot:60886-Prymnesium_polylepis.1
MDDACALKEEALGLQGAGPGASLLLDLLRQRAVTSVTKSNEARRTGTLSHSAPVTDTSGPVSLTHVTPYARVACPSRSSAVSAMLQLYQIDKATEPCPFSGIRDTRTERGHGRAARRASRVTGWPPARAPPRNRARARDRGRRSPPRRTRCSKHAHRISTSSTRSFSGLAGGRPARPPLTRGISSSGRYTRVGSRLIVPFCSCALCRT